MSSFVCPSPPLSPCPLSPSDTIVIVSSVMTGYSMGWAPLFKPMISVPPILCRVSDILTDHLSVSALDAYCFMRTT